MALNDNQHYYDHYWKRDADHRHFAPTKERKEED